MRHVSRRGFLAAGLGVAGGVVAGCSAGDDLPLPPMSDPEPTVNFLTFADGNDEAAFQELCDGFREETGIRVKMEVIPYADMAETLASRIERGVQPDVARVSDVASYKADLLDLRQYEPQSFQNPFLSQFDRAIHDGNRLVAAPSDVTVTGLLVNRDLFRRANVAVPDPENPWRSWEKLFGDARRVKDVAMSEYAFLMDVSLGHLSSLLSGYGTTFFDHTGTEVAFDVAKGTEAVTMFQQMHRDGGMPTSLFTQAGGRYKSAAEIFAAGQAPVYLAGNWQVVAYAQTLSFDWTVVRNVVQERTSAFPGARFLVALKHGQRQQEAAKFVAHMTSAASQLRLAATANHMPTRRDVRAASATYGVHEEQMELFERELGEVPSNAWGTAFASGFTPTGAVLQGQLESLLSGTATPDGVAASVRAAAETNVG